MAQHLFAVSTDFRSTWLVERYTIADAEIWATHRSHNLQPPMARYYAMAEDARAARAVVGAYGMAADAGTVAESFAVEMRGRWKAIPVISRRPVAAEA